MEKMQQYNGHCNTRQYYVNGMIEFSRGNKKPYVETLVRLVDAVQRESKEMYDEIRKCDIVETYKEFFDVVHSVLQLIFVIVLGVWILNCKATYNTLYILAYSTAKKHGIRYRDTGCILGENSHKGGRQHNCNYRGPKKCN
jgi:hypothetical protein